MSVLQDLVARNIYQPPLEFDADGESRQELAACEGIRRCNADLAGV